MKGLSVYREAPFAFASQEVKGKANSFDFFPLHRYNNPAFPTDIQERFDGTDLRRG